MKSEIIVQPTGDTLTILEGKALDPKYPEKIKLSGNIESIAQFLSKRYGGESGKGLQEVDKQKAVVTVDADKMYIALHLDPENPFGTSVSANLEFTKELLEFHINDGTEFTREALIKLVRFNKRFFYDASKHEEFLTAYMKLNLSSNSEIKQETDNRGNKDLAYKRSIDSQKIPTEFILSVPVFKGQKKERFRVEVCLSVTDASVRFWFESVELVDIIDERKTELFGKQLESCQDFVIIHK